MIETRYPCTDDQPCGYCLRGDAPTAAEVAAHGFEAVDADTYAAEVGTLTVGGVEWPVYAEIALAVTCAARAWLVRAACPLPDVYGPSANGSAVTFAEAVWLARSFARGFAIAAAD